MSQNSPSPPSSPSRLRRAQTVPCPPTFTLSSSSDEESDGSVVELTSPPNRPAPPTTATERTALETDHPSPQTRPTLLTSVGRPLAVSQDDGALGSSSMDRTGGIPTWGPPSPEVASPPSSWPQTSNQTGNDSDATDSATGSVPDHTDNTDGPATVTLNDPSPTGSDARDQPADTEVSPSSDHFACAHRRAGPP